MIEISTTYLGYVVIEFIDEDNNAHELATLTPEVVEALKEFWDVKD